MKQKLFSIIFIVSTFVFIQKLSSQTTTTTITYDNTSGLSTTKCNVFDPPVSVGGKTHTSVIGAATYSNANGLALPTNYNQPLNKTNRSDFRISYDFKAGYSYIIKFIAFANVSSGTSYPRIGASLFTAAGLSQTSTSCVAGDITGFPQIGSLFVLGLNSTSTEYTPTNGTFVSPSNYDYLLLEAYMTATSTSVSGNVYIKKLVIIETPPVSFTLSQSLTAISCGSTTPIIFTVNNGGNTTGITGYTWNLGSASNGWLYNGSAAPATITTGATVNTITLTPVCGSALVNVSATVTANSVNYTTNAASVTITPTNAIIEGNPNACTSENYIISGLPCNATVSWGITPATGIATISPLTGPSTTVTKVANGDITLTATIQSSCGAFSLSRQISVGTPVPPGINGPDHDLCYNGRNSEKAWFYVANPVSSLTYSWQIDGLVAGSGTGINVDAFRWDVGTHQIRVRSYSSACGYSAWFTSSFIVIDCSSNRFMVSPNPSSENISVSANNSGQNISKQVEVQEVELIDKMGSTRYKRKLGKGLTSANISVSNLPSDIYTLRIFDGEVWQSYKISIQH